MDNNEICVQSLEHETSIVLRLSGHLDSSTYLSTRNAIVKAATEDPSAVFVDVRWLHVTSGSAWSVLTSAAWMVRQWPDVPVVVIADEQRRQDLVRNGITRYLPVYGDLESATAALRRDVAETVVSHRARISVPRDSASPDAIARDFVASTFADWEHHECAALARVVVTILVSNVVAHTRSDPDIRVEIRSGDHFVVAVSDLNSDLPVKREDRRGKVSVISGLVLLNSLAPVWGCTPTGRGKTVWVVAGPTEIARFS